MRAIALVLLFCSCAALAPAREIPVERVRPPRGEHETLRFLRANRDFIREALDLVRVGSPADTADARAVDPRSLALRELLAAARFDATLVDAPGSADPLTFLEDEIRGLGDLAARAARLDSLLDRQSERLDHFAALYDDGASTSLRVVLKGARVVNSVTLVDEEGGRRVVQIDPSLDTAELLYERIEPRRQVLELDVFGEGPRYVTLDPEVGKIHLLELDAAAGWKAEWTTL